MSGTNPSYWVSFTEIKPRDPSVRLDNTAQWIPPKGRGANVVRLPARTFYCNGRQFREHPFTPRTGPQWRVFSMYHCHGQFWITYCDATAGRVGDGIDGDSGSSSTSDSEEVGSDVSLEEEGDGEETETERDNNDQGNNPSARADRGNSSNRRPYVGWHRLWFAEGHRAQRYISYATIFAGRWLRELRVQRADQRWVKHLLPTGYHAPPNRRSAGPHLGGLNGELPILLGLVAFSIEHNRMAELFRQCFDNGQWVLGNVWHDDWIKGWFPKRGLVVKVFLDEGTTAKDLETYQAGELGTLFR